jgi:hypothetical protein
MQDDLHDACRYAVVIRCSTGGCRSRGAHNRLGTSERTGREVIVDLAEGPDGEGASAEEPCFQLRAANWLIYLLPLAVCSYVGMNDIARILRGLGPVRTWDDLYVTVPDLPGIPELHVARLWLVESAGTWLKMEGRHTAAVLVLNHAEFHIRELMLARDGGELLPTIACYHGLCDVGLRIKAAREKQYGRKFAADAIPALERLLTAEEDLWPTPPERGFTL